MIQVIKTMGIVIKYQLIPVIYLFVLQKLLFVEAWILITILCEYEWYSTCTRKSTYKVPANLVLRKSWPSGKNLARPKSPILGWNLSSRRMLLALISLCTILMCESSCRYCNPRAIPRIIWKRVVQFKYVPLFSAPHNNQTKNPRQLFRNLII